MGGKEFKKEPKIGEERNLPYSHRLQLYDKDLNLLQERLINERSFREFRLKDNKKPTKEELTSIRDNNFEKAKEMGIKNPQAIIPIYLCRRFVEEYVVKSNYNIFNTFDEIIKNLELNEEEKESLDIIKKRFEKEFPKDLKLIKYYLNSINLADLSDIQFLGINKNLLFNTNYQPEVLSLILDDKLLDNIELVKNIADVVKNVPVLKVVNYILYPKNRDGELAKEFGLDGQNYQSLYKLIKAVTYNKNIKSFVFHSVEYYNLNLAPEICRLIEQKLQSETLVAFHFGNFNLNENWIKKIEFLLGSTKSLLFLSYENKNYTKEDVLDLKKVITKNRSIMLLSVVTPIFKGMKKEVLKKIKQTLKTDNKDSKLELIYLSHKSLVDQTWFNQN